MDPHIITRRRYSMTRPMGAAAVEIHLGLSELAKLAVWTAAYVAGAISSLFESRPATRRSASGPPAVRISPRPIRPPSPEALPLLSEAIVGSSKFTIASVLGTPRSAVVEGLAAIEAQDRGAFLQADTWYYPLPRHGQIAMAVLFADDVARSVEFFGAPGVDRLPE